MDKQTVAAYFATALLLHAGSATAQELTPIPPGQDKIVAVKKGEPVPFDGQIFDNSTALRWGNWLLQLKAYAAVNHDLDQKVCKANTDFLDKQNKLEKEQYDKVTTELQAKLTKAEEEAANTPWYRSVGFGVALGVAGTVLIGAGTAALAAAVHK
jgi:ElaB/YqjD/DUF883 family membrane-anchored ribosome-binding protein